jgi:UDP-2-acetamido-2,6-beta-L-arabino-hexul-4-ose reductase
VASDVIFHLAAANRPESSDEYARSNRDYTRTVADAVAASPRRPLVIHSSTGKVGEPGEYASTKEQGEAILLDLAESGAATVAVFRLPNVFGKWARPNYNSAVATFCHNVARGLPIRIDDAAAPLSLLYIDDLIQRWLALLASPPAESGFINLRHVHRTTVGAIATQIAEIAEARKSGRVGSVASGFERALYVTYVSYLPPEDFSYALEQHTDARGTFAEVLKTASSGQFSFLTARPGVTRGGHYHHSKVEKFVVVHGRARFRFRQVLSGEECEIETAADEPFVVETIPGWTHDITNTGEDLLVALVWANELFDPERPDTIAMAL